MRLNVHHAAHKLLFFHLCLFESWGQATFISACSCTLQTCIWKKENALIIFKNMFIILLQSLKKIIIFFSVCTVHNSSYLKLQRRRQSILCLDLAACGTTHESLSHIKNLQHYETLEQRCSVSKDFCTRAPVKKGEWLLCVMSEPSKRTCSCPPGLVCFLGIQLYGWFSLLLIDSPQFH